MGEKQSRPASAAAGGAAEEGAAAAAGGGHDGAAESAAGAGATAAGQAPVVSEVGPGGSAGSASRDATAPASEAASNGGGGGPPPAPAPADVAAAALPSESEILARLVAGLGQCPGRSMALADIRAGLPPQLQRLAEDTSSICKWLQNFKGLLEVSGPPGQEQVVLTLGRIPRAGGADPGAAGAPPSSGAPGQQPPSPPRFSGPATAGEAAGPAPAAAAEDSGAAAQAVGVAGIPGLGDVVSDEDASNPATVQLRGLPFRSTISDIKAFLGEHAAGLTTAEPAIRLLLNRDNRPSGFARIQFASPQAAQACREALHRKQMGDRYIEVLACSDRAGKTRNRRAEVGGADFAAGGAALASEPLAEHAERERVLEECREHMRMPGRSQLLLSMLGIALSPPARAYLRRANLGLKHFLARLPNEFRVEGPKGCEKVYWCGNGPMGVDGALAFGGEGWPPSLAVAVGVEQPSTPRHTGSPPAVGAAGQGMPTPSVWGTPGLAASGDGAAPAADGAPGTGFGEGGAAQTMDLAAMTGYSPYGWPQPWWGMTPWAHDGAFATDSGAVAKAAKGESKDAKNKRATAARSDVPPARSHAHLHPQSHPFASRPAGGGCEGGAPAAGLSDGELQSPVAALRLRGLPFSVTVQDVYAFFSQHDVADRIADGPQAAQLLPKANGRPSGQAVVQMRSRQDAEFAARRLSNQYIGGRYIEVFAYGGEESGDGPLPAADRDEVPAPPAGVASAGGVDLADWAPGLPAMGPWGPLPWANLMPPPAPLPGGAGGGGPFGADGDAQDPWNWTSLWRQAGEPPPGAAAAALALGAGGALHSRIAAPIAVDTTSTRPTLQV